jgi:protein gp37
MGIERFSSRRQALGPVLSERLADAKLYLRIAGYFRSSLLEVVGEALDTVQEIKVVCNGDLDPFDVKVAKAARDGSDALARTLVSNLNPVTGCTKRSAGCKYCYAEVLARRLKAMRTPGYENGFEVALHPERPNDPLKRKKPTVYFINGMSDLFHETIPYLFIDSVFETIHRTMHHRYQVLTKRPEIMLDYFATRSVPDIAWLGTSVEIKKHGLPRIPILRNIHAKIRFLSIEPLLGDLGEFDLSDLSWVIVGGESGPKARPMKVEWARSIQRQCEAKRIPFFFKQ